MLRGIQTRLVRRLERLAQQGERNTVATKALRAFLVATYPNHDVSGYGVAYDTQHQQATVTTPSKTAANDLLLRSAELGASFRKNGITLSRLVIH